jgi:truncated hemoglobin YjbI
VPNKPVLVLNKKKKDIQPTTNHSSTSTSNIPESNITMTYFFEVPANENGAVEILKQEEANLRAADGDLQEEANLQPRDGDASAAPPSSSTGFTTKRLISFPFTFVPLRMGGGGRTHTVSEGSRRLMAEQVSLADLEKMTELFYEKAFLDATLDPFIRSHDDPHGARFAKFIHQKLSGSTVWDEDRRTRNLDPVEVAGGHRHVVHDRSSAHVAAWHSVKRPAKDQGRHFELDESRVWMRLHFWALRESGLMQSSPSFVDYYVRFIAHFVRVYEGSAPQFARDSFRWSANPANIEKYIRNGRRMNDVLGLSFKRAKRQIPAWEAADVEWPYNQSPQDLDEEYQSY